MELILSILAVITAGQGGYRLLGNVTALFDEIMDNQDGMVAKVKACAGIAGGASLDAAQVMVGGALLISQVF